jgi:hypothetical protein
LWKGANLVVPRSLTLARHSGSDPESRSPRRRMGPFPRLREVPQSYLTFAQVLEHLMTSALVITDNRRVPVDTVVELARRHTLGV